MNNYSSKDNQLYREEVATLFDRPVESDPSLVLVDAEDREVGVLRKRAAHINGGVRHRAFSVFVFHTDGRMLLQRRAASKYHFGGLWTNACCGHAVPGEDLSLTAAIRLWQEMHLCVELVEAGVFTYLATDSAAGLTEWEIDHVMVGVSGDAPQSHPEEADDWRWMELAELHEWLLLCPNEFTPWFEPALRIALAQKFA
jgi:isopentenyl-diphosphate delta-isomerase